MTYRRPRGIKKIRAVLTITIPQLAKGIDDRIAGRALKTNFDQALQERSNPTRVSGEPLAHLRRTSFAEPPRPWFPGYQQDTRSLTIRSVGERRLVHRDRQFCHDLFWHELLRCLARQLVCPAPNLANAYLH
jgi:hypothetical protein